MQIRAQDIRTGTVIRYAGTWFEILAIRITPCRPLTLGGATYIAEAVDPGSVKTQLVLHGDDYGYECARSLHG
jgi:hypothetical protein